MFLAQPSQAGDFRVVHQIFAVPVVRLAIDEHAGIVQQRGACEHGAGLKIQMVIGPELIEELQGQHPNLLGVIQIAAHPASKGFRADQHFVGMLVLFFRQLRRADLCGCQLVQQPFAHADPRRDHVPQPQPGATVTSTMAATPMTSARSRRTLNDFIRPSTPSCRMCHRRSRSSRGFSVVKPPMRGPAASVARVSALPPQATLYDSVRAWPRRQRALQHGQHVQANFVGGMFVNHALGFERFHQPDSAQRQADAFVQHAVAELIQLQAAAAQIENESRRIEIAKCAQHRHPHQASLFIAGDHFQIDSGGVPDAIDQNVAVAGFARGAGGDGAIGDDLVRVHDAAEFAKGVSGIAQGLAIKLSRSKCGVAQAHRSAHRFDNFPVVRGANARDDQPKGVRAGVNRRQMDGFAEVSAPQGGQRRGWPVVRALNAQMGGNAFSQVPLFTVATLASPSIAEKTVALGKGFKFFLDFCLIHDERLE